MIGTILGTLIAYALFVIGGWFYTRSAIVSALKRYSLLKNETANKTENETETQLTELKKAEKEIKDKIAKLKKD